MSSFLTLSVLAFLFGLRHGIDWDHIAAITDITGSENNRRRSFLNGTTYIFGHALVVAILGSFVIVLGTKLPSGIDQTMEKIVGLTLIILGIWLLYSILRHGKKFRLRSRWMVIMHGASKISKRFHHFFHHHPSQEEIVKGYGNKASFIIGMIHGIGAETPTQVLLFATAAGLKNGWKAELLLFIFIAGLICSNTIIALSSVFGYKKAEKHPKIYLLLGLATALASLYIGLQFVLNGGSLLPALL